MPSVPNIHPSSALAKIDDILRVPDPEVEIHTIETLKIALKAIDLQRTNPRKCVYTTQDGDHCVIGALVVELGGQLPALEASENAAALPTVARRVNDDYYDIFGIRVTEEAGNWLCILQAYADGRMSEKDPIDGLYKIDPVSRWEECIEKTDPKLAELKATASVPEVGIQINIPDVV